MRIIKLDAIDSTNTFLRQLSIDEAIEDYTVVVARHQTNGRGQMGTIWSDQKHKNLIISLYKKVSFLKVRHSFFISIVVCLSICKVLEEEFIKNLSIKWPNDILSDNKKLCGVLIENVIKLNRLQASIVGIGLNVNQTEFANLPNASSLKNISGKVFELDELLEKILKQLKFHFELLEQGEMEQLKMEYEDRLFRKNKPSTFKDVDNNLFTGIILGISNSGNLKIQAENSDVKQYDLKEITLLY